MDGSFGKDLADGVEIHDFALHAAQKFGPDLCCRTLRQNGAHYLAALIGERRLDGVRSIKPESLGYARVRLLGKEMSAVFALWGAGHGLFLSLIHISEPTRQAEISY